MVYPYIIYKVWDDRAYLSIDTRRVTVVSGYKPWARSAWQRDNTGSGTQNGSFTSELYLA